MKKLLAAVALSVISVGASAVDVFTPNAIPKKLHIYSSSGDAFVDMPTVGCAGGRYILSVNHVKFDAIFSLLLTAQTTGTEISLRINGCNSQNQGNIVGAFLNPSNK
jgi:hypothetical protein